MSEKCPHTVTREKRSERIRVVREEILEAEKLGQPGRLCQLYALLHKTEGEEP